MIDAHTHFFAEPIAKDPHGWAAARGEVHWASTVLAGFPNTLQAWPSAAEFVQAMDDAHIEKAVLLGWYWENQSTCEEQFEHYLQLRAAYPNRFYIFAPVQPLAGAAAMKFAQYALDNGAVGFGEFLPFLNGYSLKGNTAWMTFCEWCADKKIPLNFHVTDPLGHAYPGRVETPLSEYLWLAESFPSLPIILAHWGGGVPFFAMNPRVGNRLANVYYDSAASPRLYDNRIWPSVLSSAGADKVLWGSDYSLRLYNGASAESGWKRFAAESEEVVNCTHPGVWHDVSRDNFLRLIGELAR